MSRARAEWQLGQTLANLAMTAGRLDSGAGWDPEDEEALAAVRGLLGQYSKGERVGVFGGFAAGGRHEVIGGILPQR